jgi:selenophosphate synthetase-related protein
VAAIDLRGRFQEPYAYWNASTGAPAERLRADLEVLPGLAEAGLVRAAKDISMAGVIGTALMLLECSGKGAVIDLDAVPARRRPISCAGWAPSPAMVFCSACRGGPAGSTVPLRRARHCRRRHRPHR